MNICMENSSIAGVVCAKFHDDWSTKKEGEKEDSYKILV